MREDAHARPTGEAPEPLYDVEVPTPTHAERARTLVGQISTGTLCTLALEPQGYPYGSFVTVAFDNGNPIFLISGLADIPGTWSVILARRCWWPRAAVQIRSPTAASRCSGPVRASKGMGAARVPHSSPPIRTPLTMLTSEISRSGSCTWSASGTLASRQTVAASATQGGRPDPLPVALLLSPRFDRLAGESVEYHAPELIAGRMRANLMTCDDFYKHSLQPAAGEICHGPDLFAAKAHPPRRLADVGPKCFPQNHASVGGRDLRISWSSREESSGSNDLYYVRRTTRPLGHRRHVLVR
jgi:hypothetical protein